MFPVLSQDGHFNFDQLVSKPQRRLFFKKDKPIQIVDFGTIFIGLSRVKSPEYLQEVLSLSPMDNAPVFEAPEHFQWAHVATELGIFDSVNQARKNGWNTGFEDGCNERLCKIQKIQGVIFVVKITDSSPWAQEFIPEVESKKKSYMLFIAIAIVLLLCYSLL